MNGNTQFGTATPHGNVNVDEWLDSAASDTAFSAGVLSGFSVTPSGTSGFGLSIGGQAGVNSTAIAKNSNGDTTRIGGNSTSSYTLTLAGAPGTSGQSQVNSIVVYMDPTVTSMVQNGTDTVGLISVAGTAASTGSQTAPSDAQIRNAIPNGSVIFYAVIANVTLSYGNTAIAQSQIKTVLAQLSSSNIDFATFQSTGPGRIQIGKLLVQWATVGVNVTSANQAANTPVTFPIPYASNPAVTAALWASNPQNVFFTAAAVSSTGCTMFVNANSTGSRTIQWCAIGFVD